MSNLAPDCRLPLFHSHLVVQSTYPSDSTGSHPLADHIPGMFPNTCNNDFLSEFDTSWNQLYEAPSLAQYLDLGNPSLLSNSMAQPFTSTDFGDMYLASTFNFNQFGALDSGDTFAFQATNNQSLSQIHPSSPNSFRGLPSDSGTQPPNELLPTLPAPINYDHHDDAVSSSLGRSKRKSMRSLRAERDNAIGKENHSRQKGLKAGKCSAECDPAVNRSK
ncbi:hypothetical protein JVU11DRAFT_3034 [Chiua virens]|nr:hypothetical protein JVU11DRAFT_3034 [Chiua virens]